MSAGIATAVFNNLLKSATIDVIIPLIFALPDNSYSQRVFLTNPSATAILGNVTVADDQKAKTAGSLTVTLKNTGALSLLGSLTVVAIVQK